MNKMASIEEALEQLRQGKMVVLVDDEDRENEGDLVLAAEHATAQQINFMISEARGLVCLSLPRKKVEELRLPMMNSENESPRQTAFTVSIEARCGVTTGISAADRAHTIRLAAASSTKHSDLVSPGHIFPLRAVDGGVLVRAGHTEGSLDLVKIAGLEPAAVICEIMRKDGEMARMPDLESFAKHFDLPLVTIRDLIAYRMNREILVNEIAKAHFPTRHGDFELRAYRSVLDGTEHLALIKGPLTGRPLVRVHSECLTGDALGSLRCDCGSQLDSALKQISQIGNGVLVYMRTHEGRGIGLGNKIRAYSLQDQGMDTVEANRHLGFGMDLRQYGLGAQILKSLGISELDLLTNNPRKIVGLDGYGLRIKNRIPLEITPNPHNLTYLTTKKEKLGHELNFIK